MRTATPNSVPLNNTACGCEPLDGVTSNLPDLESEHIEYPELSPELEHWLLTVGVKEMEHLESHPEELISAEDMRAYFNDRIASRDNA